MEQLQRIETLEKQYRTLSVQVERLIEQEKQHDFTIRDSSVKIGIAQGLSETSFKEIRQLSLEMHQLRAEMHEIRRFNDEHFDRLEHKMDMQEERFHQKLDVLESLLKQVLERK